MKVLLTLDYELFLGTKTGSVQKCLIEPMKRMLFAIEPYNARFSIMVDATYLHRLNDYAERNTAIKNDFEAICNHLRVLSRQGHDIQLHIHPHWYYSEFDGSEWHLDKDHYKLCDLPKEDALRIFRDSKNLLDRLVGYKTTAFRAGGFSTQPTSMLAGLFEENGIKIDTSVCPKTKYNSPQQQYDYSTCPKSSFYHFSEDICKESDDNMGFIEIPISMYRLSPLFYWRLVATRMMNSEKHRNFGDGISVKTTGESIKERLLKPTWGMVSIDGYKASYLKRAFDAENKKNADYFCVLGHPKLATPYSIEKLGEFCKYAREHGVEFVNLGQLK